MNKIVVVGPWGGSGGGNWYFKAEGKIIKIVINHGDCIDSISFTSQDDDGNVYDSERFGGSGGDSDQVNLDFDVEDLIGISGTVGYHDSMMVVTSLSFTTNINKFGPFGTEDGTHFSLPVSKASFFGFYGRSGAFLDAIGVYLKPI